MKDTLKFTVNETEFFVNKEKQVVVCKLTGRLKGFSGNIENGLVSNNRATSFSVNDYEAVMTFTGKAKCSSEDTFDEKVGRQIAESRAKMKAYATMHEIASKAKELYHHQLSRCSDVANKYLQILTTEAARVEKLAKMDD